MESWTVDDLRRGGFRSSSRLVALTALLCAGASVASATEIPESIHRAYLKGATSVVLPSDPVTIPLQGTDWGGHYRSPYVRVLVNGHGPYTFLFDTGSNTTIVSSKVAREASLAIVSAVPGHHRIAEAREIDASGVRMRDYYVVIADGDDLDGILGFNAFAKNYLTFDLKRRTLVVGSRPNVLPSAFWLPYALDRHLPKIALSIGGRRLPTLIDSGDDAYAWEGTSEDLRGLLFDSTPVYAGIVYNGQTGATSTRITTVDGTLKMGPVYADRPAVAIDEALPLPDIGVDVIEQFVMEFDRVHRRVGFQPLFSGREFVVRGELTCGLEISFLQPVRRVKGVLAGSAPTKAGAQAGDVVTDIDGRNARDVTYRQWDELVRTRAPIRIAWVHAGRPRSATFSVVELK
jgi:aspartyl protease